MIRNLERWHRGDAYKTINDLELLTTYYWRVSCTNNSGTSDCSDIWSFTTFSGKSKPTVETLEATNISENSATLNGKIISDGGDIITEKGFYWSSSITNPGPDSGGKKVVVDGTSTENFDYYLNNLDPNTIYYYLAYAINNEGISVGQATNFTTSEENTGESGTFTDSRDGHEYKWVEIGDQVWMCEGLLSDTCNLDFTTIPYWGDDAHLENSWSGKRNKALSSMLAILAQDPDSGIIDYGSSDVLHANQSKVVLEYLDFYKQTRAGKQYLKYLVFDSKFTNYENLSTLDDEQVKFITIRRRGGKLLEQISKNKTYKTIRVEASGLKKRTLKVRDQQITLQGYRDSQTKKLKSIRQVTITGHGKIKPALILTNDFEIPLEKVVRKYCRRWLVEKGISEQIEFFHLNRVSSSMVIKVDFDLTMTIAAHNLYRLFALDMERYSQLTDERIYEKFIVNNGFIQIDEKQITIELKKKMDLPQIIEMMKKYADFTYHWLDHKKIVFYPSSTT